MYTSNIRTLIVFLCLLVTFSHCKNENEQKDKLDQQSILNTKSEVEEQKKGELKETNIIAEKKPSAMIAKGGGEPNCEIKGKVIEDNDLWIEKENQLIHIIADKSTYDPNFGDSYRILKAFNPSCETIFQTTLPINRSPEFPYYIDSECYNSKNGILAIQGYNKVLCYDIVTKKMLPPLTPKYINTDAAVDASSGAPYGIKMWGNYLIAYAQDFGPYVFDFSNKKKPVPVEPNVIYGTGNQTKSLFLLKSNENLYQAFMPKLDDEEGVFITNALLPTPKSIKVFNGINGKDKIDLTDINGKKLVTIDMKNQKLMK